MKILTVALDNGYRLQLWKGAGDRYTAVLWRPGEPEAVGHGKTAKQALKNARKGIW